MNRNFAKRLILILCVSLLLCGAVLFRTSGHAEQNGLSMLVGSSCYIYASESAKTANRAGYVTFGQSLEVTDLGDTWAQIQYEGQTRFILTKNLRYPTKTVVKNRVMVSPGAFACSTKSTLGYVFYGTKVSVLGIETSKKGVDYLHCLIPEVYSDDGATVLGTQVEGYINMAYLTETATPKIVNGGTPLYACAFGSSAAEELKQPVGYITTGEEVNALMSNGAWTKVRYGGKEYFVSSGKLDPKVCYITVRRAAQTADARPGSGILHYVYWNTPITVLNTYESSTYGTYYYCNISGDYGFVREYSTSGTQYVGYNSRMVTNTTAKVYPYADSEAPVLQTMLPGTEVNVQYTSGNWARVSIDGQTGYILLDNLTYPEYLLDGAYYTTAYRLYKKTANGTGNETVQLLAKNETYGYAYIRTAAQKCYWVALTSLHPQASTSTMYVSAPWVVLHTQPANDSPEFMIPYMTEVQMAGSVSDGAEGGWHKLYYEGTPYYIWIPAGESPFTATQSTYTYPCETQLQQSVIDLAMTICNEWKTKYAHGQSNGIPDSDGVYGFDCSGFAAYVLNTVIQQRVPTYRISANLQTLYQTEGIYNSGLAGAFSAQDVTLDTLQPGDVLFFNTLDDSQTVDHCGIYLGNGEFVQSSSSWDGDVCVMPLKDFYQERLIGIRRYIPEQVLSADTARYSTSGAAKLYSQKSDDSEVIRILTRGEKVTLLFTDNGNWAYVRTSDGKFGFVLIKYLSV